VQKPSITKEDINVSKEKKKKRESHSAIKKTSPNKKIFPATQSGSKKSPFPAQK
jgi:hypothetical protein